MSLINIPLIVKEYVIKMLHEASVGMKALIVDDLTVSSSFFDLLDLATNLDTLPCWRLFCRWTLWALRLPKPNCCIKRYIIYQDVRIILHNTLLVAATCAGFGGFFVSLFYHFLQLQVFLVEKLHVDEDKTMQHLKVLLLSSRNASTQQQGLGFADVLWILFVGCMLCSTYRRKYILDLQFAQGKHLRRIFSVYVLPSPPRCFSMPLCTCFTPFFVYTVLLSPHALCFDSFFQCA